MDYKKPPEIPRILHAAKRACQQPFLIAKADGTGKWKRKVSWENLQCISSFEIPKGWKATEPGGQGIVQSWISPNKKDYCSISISYHSFGLVRGNAPERRLRKKLLTEPVHKLSELEIDKLYKLLFHYRDSKNGSGRKLLNCETRDLNGKRAIYVETVVGADTHAPMAPERKRMTFFIDPTGEAMDYLKIEYNADVKIFDKYKEQAIKAIDSVKWKQLSKKYDEEYYKSAGIDPS